MTEHYMQRYKYVLTDVLYGWELGKLKKKYRKIRRENTNDIQIIGN